MACVTLQKCYGTTAAFTVTAVPPFTVRTKSLFTVASFAAIRPDFWKLTGHSGSGSLGLGRSCALPLDALLPARP